MKPVYSSGKLGLFARTIEAMRSCEDGVNAEMNS